MSHLRDTLRNLARVPRYHESHGRIGSTMKITVRYFALLRERMGCESEVLPLDDAEPTVGRLRGLLAERAPALADFLRGGTLLVAVNREYATAAAVLKDGDEVAFFPPVTGG